MQTHTGMFPNATYGKTHSAFLPLYGHIPQTVFVICDYF